jgi:hypothetical protein
VPQSGWMEFIFIYNVLVWACVTHLQCVGAAEQENFSGCVLHVPTHTIAVLIIRVLELGSKNPSFNCISLLGSDWLATFLCGF